MEHMTAETRRALLTIRRCVNADRFHLLPHFLQRMDERGMTWPDVLALIDAPAGIEADGCDDWARPRWIVTGEASDGLTIGLVCVIGRNDAGELTVFITLFWED